MTSLIIGQGGMPSTPTKKKSVINPVLIRREEHPVTFADISDNTTFSAAKIGMLKEYEAYLVAAVSVIN